MASMAGSGAAPGMRSNTGLRAFIDRWIFVFMAALFVATTLVGFIPDSLSKIAAIAAGQRASFPLVLHFHAVLMGSWLLLLLTQTTLMATGRDSMHKQLGLASMALAPAIVLTGIALVPTMYYQKWDAAVAAPPELQMQMRGMMAVVSNIVLVQFRAGILFAVFVGLALRARKTDPAFHKRMMFIATAMPLPAAIDRIGWLPSSFPANYYSQDAYVLLWLAPLFLWDIYRQGRVHRVYVVAFCVWLPFAAVLHSLWGSPLWQNYVPHLFGVAS